MGSSTVVSCILFLLVLVFSRHMCEALGAQTEIRKLKETITMRRDLEGNNNERSSKMWTGPSTTTRCGGGPGGRTFENMATTNKFRPGHGPLPGGYLSSLCPACGPYSTNCYTIRCTTTTVCQSYNGSPMTCTKSENCEPVQL